MASLISGASHLPFPLNFDVSPLSALGICDRPKSASFTWPSWMRTFSFKARLRKCRVNKNKGYNKNFNKGSNRDSSKGPNQKPKRAPKADNRDPFEKAFDARFDPASTRGPAQKSQW